MDLVDKDYVLLKPKAIIFDWDNTLVDTWELIHEATNHTLVKYGKPTLTLEETKIRIHKSSKEIMMEFFPNDDWQAIGNLYRTRYAELRDKISPLPDASDTLKAIADKGIYAGIVSNKLNTFLTEEVKALQWGQYFKTTFGSGDFEHDKPSPIAVHSTLEQIKLKPSDEIWFVGDTITDMETAYNAKCAPIFFGEGDYKEAGYAHCRPKVHFHTHSLLAKYLQAL